LNMPVSVTRTTGRNSRGVVKWIGTLPSHDGQFLGVELESESKLFNNLGFHLMNTLGEEMVTW